MKNKILAITSVLLLSAALSENTYAAGTEPEVKKLEEENKELKHELVEEKKEIERLEHSDIEKLGGKEKSWPEKMKEKMKEMVGSGKEETKEETKEEPNAEEAAKEEPKTEESQEGSEMKQ